MGKSSGSTRASASGSPRGFNIQRAADELRASINARQTEYQNRVEQDIRIIQSKGFKDMGGGVWELTSDNADVSVIQEYSPYDGNVYRINGMGATWNDGEYREASAAGEGDAYRRSFSSLNAAKRAAREELEDYYRRHNS